MMMLLRYLPPLNSATTALAILLSGTAHLSWKYHTSAAFEYPVVFSLSTLIWCAVASTGFATWNTRRRIRLRTVVAIVREAPYPLLWWPGVVTFIVSRTLLLGVILRNVQCSIDGVYAFLPASLALLEAVLPRTLRPESESETLSYYKESTEAPSHTSSLSSSPRLLKEKNDDLPQPSASSSNIQNGRTTRGPLVRYIILALAWGLLARRTLVLMTRPVGTVCPTYSGWDRGQLIPAAEVLMLVLDTQVIIQVVRMQRAGSSSESNIGNTNPGTGVSTTWASLGILSFCSAVVLTVVAFGLYPAQQLLSGWAPAVEKLILRDLIRESAVASAVAIAAISLLSFTHPATLAAITGVVGLFIYLVKQVKDEKANITSSPTTHTGRWEVKYVSLSAIAFSFFLVRSEGWLFNSSQHRTPTSWTRQRWLTFCYLGFILFLIKIPSGDSSPGNATTRVSAVIDHAQKASIEWMQNAVRSRSLQEAVAEYRLRYGIPPPPHFDKWYDFAVERKSPVIDSYDQIHHDLLPFWGIPTAQLRSETTRLVEQTRLGIGGFRIKGHKVTLSHITPGTHFWMMEGFRSMVEPFLEWLPDMDLAFNLDDECRVVVPFSEMQRLTDLAREARKRVVPLYSDGANSNSSNAFSAELTPPWTDDYLAEGYKDAHKDDAIHPAFSIRSPYHSIFDTFITPTCPPSSPALTSRWWSRRESLPSGRGIVTDYDASLDVCQRPDMAQMHGFLLDPGAFGVSRTLLPIFSQGRIPGFRDILVPSPWNYRSKVDIKDDADRPWASKMNSIFWRGASSDGVGRHAAWTAFLRTRFAWLARQFTPTATTSGEATEHDLIMNVSFVGNFSKCDREDCRAQAVSFYGAPEVADPPKGMDFQEHWAHQHLVDLDGAGFSGRFIPFMKSRSLVYRVSLFRTWYDERVHAWQHYVPLDVSLVDSIWDLVRLLVGAGNGSEGSQDGDEDDENSHGLSSMSAAEKIALNGRDWARKALRKEDMEVYMFRLLLEWARLIDDRREELAFEFV